MDSSGRISYRIILFSLLAQVVPLVLFPEMLGMDLAQASLVHVLYEFVYFGIVAWIYNRSTSLLQIGRAALVCLGYRLVMGVVFGLLIAAMYGMGLGVSIRLGVFSYIPTVLLHVAFAPFILKPVLDQMIGQRRRRVRRPEPRTDQADAAPNAKEHAWSDDVSSTPTPAPAPVRREQQPAVGRPDRADNTPAETNGFEKAVRYIGEHGSVSLAAVVDSEGLLMARFVRGEVDPEEWAPTSLVLFETNHRMLQQYELGDAEKLDFSLMQKRVVIMKAGNYSLVVIADRQTDDVVQIRIRQAIDLINKFVAERYGSMQEQSREQAYVSGTE